MCATLQEKSYRSIPVLLKYVRRLHTIAELMEKHLRIDDEDHFGFMCTFFLSKQLIHAKSVLTLVDSGQFSDSTPIARMMIDGMISLLWASRNSAKRALDWRSFALISDFRLMLGKKRRSEFVDPANEEGLRDRLKKECQQFLTKNARKALQKGESLPEGPYRNKWALDDSGKTVQIEDAFAEVGGQVLYELYSDMSDWVHWNVRGIGTKIERDEGSVVFRPNPPNDAAMALASAFQALLQTMELVNDYLRLGFDDKLRKIRGQYVNDIAAVST
jgi:hypothetical protein